MKHQTKRFLKLIRDGKIEAGSERGMEILKEALIEDVGLTVKAMVHVPKQDMIRAMKSAGFNSGEIAHVLFQDVSARAVFLDAERELARRMGNPEVDRYGYSIEGPRHDAGLVTPAAAAADARQHEAHDPWAMAEHLDPAYHMRRLVPR